MAGASDGRFESLDNIDFRAMILLHLCKDTLNFATDA
jgi:hypothetical protein